MRSIVTGVLAGTAALSLLLAPAYAAPTRTGAADAGPDPTALAHLIQAQKYTDKTAWARSGGTYKSVCDSSFTGRSVWVIQLDLSTGAERYKIRQDTHPDIPMVSIYKGRTMYSKLSATIRKSLRVHGVSSPAKWVTAHRGKARPAERPVLRTDRSLQDADWKSLTEAPRPGGGSIFTGSGHDVGNDTVTFDAITYTDATGRLVSATSHRYQGGELLYECVETWDWSAPGIKIPTRKTQHNSPRYRAEQSAVGEVAEIKWEGDARLSGGETPEQIVAWLHKRVRPKDRLAHGIEYTRQYPHQPALRFRIVVKHGAVDFRPVR